MEWPSFRIHKRLHLNSAIIQLIYQTLAEIDGIKNSWLLTKQLLPQTIERLTRSMIVTSKGASNRFVNEINEYVA